MAVFPKKAKVVIVGLGGIVGASIAHHLIERGWDDIVGIDKSGIPTDIGSTVRAQHLMEILEERAELTELQELSREFRAKLKVRLYEQLQAQK